jgi:hypothetical protein
MQHKSTATKVRKIREGQLQELVSLGIIDEGRVDAIHVDGDGTIHVKESIKPLKAKEFVSVPSSVFDQAM